MVVVKTDEERMSTDLDNPRHAAACVDDLGEIVRRRV